MNGSSPTPRVLLDGCAFTESPRWHDERLWFCDWAAHEVIALGLDGAHEVIAEIESFPFCIDFLPDGRLLAVSAADQKVFRREPDGSLATHADLVGLEEFPWNDIAADGSLSNRRVWADLGENAPDGICLDADGAVWFADVPHRYCRRVAEGGKVLQTVELDRGAFACALGGPDGRTLFMVGQRWDPSAMRSGERTGQVMTVDVDVPGVGHR